MSNDRFSYIDGFKDTPVAPSRHFTAVSPNDATDLVDVPKALFFGGAGDVKVIGIDAPASATGIVFTVAAGTILPIRPRRVLATGTTATGIVALF